MMKMMNDEEEGAESFVTWEKGRWTALGYQSDLCTPSSECRACPIPAVQHSTAQHTEHGQDTAVFIEGSNMSQERQHISLLVAYSTLHYLPGKE